MDEETRTTDEAADAPLEVPAARVTIRREFVLDVVVPASVVREVLILSGPEDPDAVYDSNDHKIIGDMLDAARRVARINGTRERRSLDRVTVEWIPPEVKGIA